MRIALFGDIHSNLEALQSVLADAQIQDCTHYICLGDLVGYSADPAACIETVRALDCPVIKGNHDEQAAMSGAVTGFTDLADVAIRWTRQQLGDEDKEWLRSLRLQRVIRDFTVVHATLDTPHKWGYIVTPGDAAASFTYQHTPVCFFGHTHEPFLYRTGIVVKKQLYDTVRLHPGTQYMINVGSVGQPRDGDWRAAYVIYQPETMDIELRRVPYDIETAQRKIIDAGLPEELAHRLAVGK
ncbi:MAG: metallophosphoesterase family protein [Chthoniobacterales bacterium]|nr:metallophosphoesterase family protein [Chthoniobacterales bacterium]